MALYDCIQKIQTLGAKVNYHSTSKKCILQVSIYNGHIIDIKWPYANSKHSNVTAAAQVTE